MALLPLWRPIGMACWQVIRAWLPNSSTAAQAGALILRLHMLVGILLGCAHLLAWPFVPRSLRGQQS